MSQLIDSAVSLSGQIDTGSVARRTTTHRYELVELMSRSSRCDVWCAIDLITEERRVVKVAQDHYGFRDECLAVTELGHRNLVGTIERGRLADGRAYVVQPYVEALSLRRYLAHGALSVAQANEVIVQIARGLAAAHASGVVHGAITPEHVLLTEPEPIRAKLLGLGTSLGDPSPEYAAPEQWGGGSVDARADVFALGAIAIEMMTGRGPFASNDLRPRKDLAQRPRAKLVLSDELADLDRVLRRAICDAPAERWPDVASFVVALTGDRSVATWLARGSEMNLPVVPKPATR